MAAAVTSLAKLSEAKRALASARTLHDVLDIRDQAEALRAYVKAAGEGLDAANAASEIKLRAERKAGEMLAGMEKNPGGGDQSTGNGVLPVPRLEDLGIDKMQSSRWQREAAVSEEQFVAYILTCAEKAREVTQAGLLKIANGSHVSSSGENEWYTPPEYIEAARQVMGSIDLDPASCEAAQANVKAKRFFSIDQDGLSQAWFGNVWLNPPYSKDCIGLFAEKLVFEANRFDQAIVLVNNATDTEWFHKIAAIASAICFLQGRVRFFNKDGKRANAPVQGQAVIYIGPGVQRFINRFCGLGFVGVLAREAFDGTHP